MHGTKAFEGASQVVERILALEKPRSIIAIAGPPGGGKSTFADYLVEQLKAAGEAAATVVPMDGFHFDDTVLESWGLRQRKGSPQTFDVGGLRATLSRLKTNHEPYVAVPVFDRAIEIARAGGRLVERSVKYVVVEGNYLLLDAEPWSSLAPFFDLTVQIEEDRLSLEQRLMERWLSLGFDERSAREKVQGNDMVNADLVLSQSRDADFKIRAAGHNGKNRA